MKVTLHRIGNSRGVIIPKPLLAQVGLAEEIDMLVAGDTIVLRKPCPAVREGWAQSARALAAAGEDALVWPEFANEDDARFLW